MTSSAPEQSELLERIAFPFGLLDVVGDDVSLAIQRELCHEFREPGFAPAPLLEHLVTAGYLGRKTKRGFRDYTVR
jgi:3-hydroxybutyryl-CoA dehydrogenase